MKRHSFFSAFRIPVSLAFFGSLWGFSIATWILLALLSRQFQQSWLESLTKQKQEFATLVSATSKFADQILIDAVNQIYYDDTVTQLRESEDLSNYDFIKGIRQINAITAFNTLIDSIYIYNGKTGWIYSTAQYGAVNDPANRFLDRQAALLLEKRNPDDRFHLIPRSSPQGRTNGQIYSYLFFETDAEGSAKPNAVLLNLRPSSFTRLYFPSENCFIIDHAGKFVASSTGKEPVFLNEIDQLIQEDLEHKGYVQIGDILCFYTPMEEHGWVYIQTLSEQAAFGSLLHARNKTFFLVHAIIILTCLILLFLAVKLYLPLRRFTLQISAATTGKKSQDAEKALRSLSQLIDEHGKHESVRPMVKNELLNSILQNGTLPDSASGEISSHHLSIVIDMPLTLVLVSGCDMAQTVSSLQEMVPACEGLMANERYGFVFLQCSGQEDKQLLTQLLLEHAAYVVASDEFANWSQISMVASKLRELWNLRFLHPETRFIALSDAMHLSHSITPLSEQSALIITCVKKGSYSKAMESLDELIRLLDGKNYSPVRTTLLNLGYRLLKMAYDHARLERGLEEVSRDYQKMVDSLEDIASLRAYLAGLMKETISTIQKDQQEDKGQVSQQVISYIEENYANPELSTKLIADAFGMSPAYLSRLFKHNQQERIAQHLNHVRIREAKHLLGNPDTQVKDVPSLVGISNGQYFFHLFKKETGMTPKEYQRMVFTGQRQEVR